MNGPRRLLVLATALMALVVWGCAGGGGPREAGPCALTAADSVFLAAGPLYPACAVDREARLHTNTARVDFRPTAAPESLPGEACYSAEVRLVVGADGQVEPGSARLVRATDPAFGQALLESTAGWRYDPARVDGEPVRQVVEARHRVAVRVTVMGQGGASRPPRC